EQLPPFFCSASDCGPEAQPARIAGNERLGQKDKPRPLASSLPDQRCRLLDRTVAIEEHRGSLHGRDTNRSTWLFHHRPCVLRGCFKTGDRHLEDSEPVPFLKRFLTEDSDPTDRPAGRAAYPASRIKDLSRPGVSAFLSRDRNEGFRRCRRIDSKAW